MSTTYKGLAWVVTYTNFCAIRLKEKGELGKRSGLVVEKNSILDPDPSRFRINFAFAFLPPL